MDEPSVKDPVDAPAGQVKFPSEELIHGVDGNADADAVAVWVWPWAQRPALRSTSSTTRE